MTNSDKKQQRINEGFCPICSDFCGGEETFDIYGICDECRWEIERKDAEYDADEDWGDDDD